MILILSQHGINAEMLTHALVLYFNYFLLEKRFLNSAERGPVLVREGATPMKLHSRAHEQKKLQMQKRLKKISFSPLQR